MAVADAGIAVPGSAARRVGAQPRWMRDYVRCVAVLDAGCAGLAGVVAVAVAAPASPRSLALILALPLVWIAAVGLAGGYQHRFLGEGTEEFRRVSGTGAVLLAGVATVSFALSLGVDRGHVLVGLPALTVLSLAGRYAWRKRLHRRRSAGQCMRRVIVVGHSGAAADLLRQLHREPYHGMRIVGLCVPDPPNEAEARALGGAPVMGDFAAVPDAVLQAEADTVAVVSCPEMDGARLRRLAWSLERIGADLTVAPALMEVAGPRTSIRAVAGLPLLHVEHPRLGGWPTLLKGVVDRLAAGAALVLLAPVFLVVAMLIRRDSPGPALFRQTRVGRAGTEFRLYKFRTMVSDAEEQRSRLSDRNESDGVLFKIRDDPRVTRVGSWLRRTSVDELPQLINVVAGHMSLVGPRPPLPEEVARYGDDVRRRLVVKPGMTGLWQVSGRSDLSWEESVRLDLRYVENWSLTLDVQILWKTWSAVMRGAGAY